MNRQSPTRDTGTAEPDPQPSRGPDFCGSTVALISTGVSRVPTDVIMLSRYLLLAGVLISLTGCRSATTRFAEDDKAGQPRNVIFFISDGCGPASFTMARQFVGWRDGADRLALDDILVGSARTHPADEYITDSAASGTALACGVKTRNGALAVDESGQPVATVLEAAESLGMATGLVATSTITHATPASFSAHVLNRAHQDSVALWQLGQEIEVLLGGGADFFLPVSQGGLRTDERDLIDEARQAGYAVARSRADLLQITQAPVLGLFSGGHMSYEIDRDEQVQPGLAEMTRYAIELLSQDPDGFFLMVEGSKIDHAAHQNDVPAHLYDILAYDDAVAAALEFARADRQTLIIATSDHETGGLTVGTRVNQISAYTWHPERLPRASHSLAYAADSLFGKVDGPRLLELLGIADPTAQELEVARDTTWSWQAMAAMMSQRARVGWTTGGHTAVDVPVFAFGPGSRNFAGNLDNTEIGQRLAELMQVDLGQLTLEIRKERLYRATQPAGS